MPDRLLLEKRLRKSAQTLVLLAMLAGFFYAANHGLLCDEADPYCSEVPVG